MTDRELMQMALQALQESKPIDINDPTAFYRSAHAIEALRVALAQPELGVTLTAAKHPVSLSKPSGYKLSKESLEDVVLEREWQGLTEGETIDLALSAFELPEVSSETREKIHRDLVIAMNDQDSRLMLFAANIEAKLKEKNGCMTEN